MTAHPTRSPSDSKASRFADAMIGIENMGLNVTVGHSPLPPNDEPETTGALVPGRLLNHI